MTMKGFKNSTKMQSGHNPSAAGRTVGRVMRFAEGGSVPGGINGVADFHSDMNGSSSVRRQTPSSVEDADTGGTSPLRPGYAAGGSKKEKHFHVHNHYHNGKKMPGKSKLKSLEKKATGGTINKVATGGTINKVKGGGKVCKADGGHIHDETDIVPDGYGDYATGGTINRLSAGGGLYATGGTIDKFAVGGMPQGGIQMGGRPGMLMQGALGNLAAQPRAMPMQPAAQAMPQGMPMQGGPRPLMRARGGITRATAPRSAATAAVKAHVESPAPRGHKGLGALIRGK